MSHIRAVINELGLDIPSGIKKISIETKYNYDINNIEVKPYEVIVEVKAAAINFPDLLMTHGGYQHKPILPYTPGTEASGVVLKIGKNVKNIKVGDHVICGAREGMMQNYITVPVTACSKLPHGLSFSQGASFNVAYTTAYHCLVERAQLTTKDTVLINGATGGVGSAAVEVARAIGCKTIIATGTTTEKMDVIKQKLGATHVIDFAETNVKDMSNIVKNMTGGKGVDVVYDPVGGEIWENSLKSTAWGARVAIVGWASKVQPSVRTNYILIKGLTILGCRAGESVRRGFANNRRRMATLFQWIANGKLKPNISHCFHINNIHEAFETVYMRKVIGKAIIEFDNLNKSKL
jgi:NADPH:quinone reductase